MRRTLLLIVILLAAFVLTALVVSRGAFGVRQDGGQISTQRRSADSLADVRSRQRLAGAGPGAKQILFGDLHVHTTFSFDAFNISLPMYQGEGAHPPGDACDFARFCSQLDFWSINDHAEGLTPHQWRETRDMVRQCNSVAGDPDDPDMVTFLGWEWTQIGTTPEDHYGHKNVVLRNTADDAVPRRPISSRQSLFPGGTNPYNAVMRLGFIAAGAGDRGRQPYHDFARFLQDRAEVPACDTTRPVRELPDDCQESAYTPGELFDRLDDWGHDYLVIPHGNTWGFYTPPLTSWDKQLAAHRDPEQHEFLFEVFSGHGNTEQYRPFRALEIAVDGTAQCPAPTLGYTPECWQAGEIIRTRCLAAGADAAECESRARLARSLHVEAGDSGYLTVPGSRVEDWLDSGQCRDCYMPAYNYRPMGSLQYALALRDFSAAASPRRFRFGIIASSDVHTARPGTGYKEFARRKMTDAGLGLLGPPKFLRERDPLPKPIPLAEAGMPGPYFERFASFFGAGGLVAAHSTGRDRDSIWQALQRKEVYGTSGDRILLWFDALGRDGGRHPMGSSLERRTAPAFEVRAVGAFEQKPGCPPDSVAGLSGERLERLCGGECYYPDDLRKPIDRIEVVRIRPRNRADEPVGALIEDPWRVLECPAGEAGCRVTFSDADFARGARDAVYYVRAIQRASPTVNGDNLRCTDDATGACIATQPCSASDDATPYADDCLTLAEERAWSSPIFVDYAQ
jgi:hypothetical protein